MNRAKRSDKSPNRPKEKLRWVVGIHSCKEALTVRPKSIREVWLGKDWIRSQQLSAIHALAERSRIPVQTRSENQFEQLSSGHQGVAVACVDSPKIDWTDLEEMTQGVVIILDGLEDPHNLGSVLRTAWLTDVKAIFIPPDRAVGLTATVCKIASGGAEHVPVDGSESLSQVMARLKELGFWIYGLSEAGKVPPWKLNLGPKVVWVIGSEGSGLRKTTERACDELVRLPQVEGGSSYNAAIAGGMALAETCRQLGKPQ